MKPRPSTPHSEALVQRVNELYHDDLNEAYHDALPEIFDLEGDRWRALARDFLAPRSPLTLVEIGTGTGFVPLTIAPLLSECDLFICSDLSQGILDVAARNLNAAKLPCRFEFRKIERAIPLQLPFASDSADAVLMNSVLHHIADTAQFLAEIDRVLKPGGLVISAHEPNRYFYEHFALMANYRALHAIFNFRMVAIAAARRSGLISPLRRLYYFFRPGLRQQMGEKSKYVDRLCARINGQLLREKLTTQPLANEVILDLVDVRAGEGFYFERLLPTYRLLHHETYHHLFWVMVYHHHRRIVRRYNDWLGKRFPQHGATFVVVYEKPVAPIAKHS